MINFLFKMFCLLILCFLLLTSVVAPSVAAPSATVNNKQNNVLIEQLKINQGMATFIQKKHFSFLSNPIVSKGLLLVNKGNIIWQVEHPIFSKTAIINNDIWQYDGTYKKMASHSSIASLLKAVFSGDIDENQWQVSFIKEQCIQLKPKDAVLSQAIFALEVCLTEQTNIRHVQVEDAQNNTTKIVIEMIRETLSKEEYREFELTP